MKVIYLYGIAGAEKAYRVVRWEYIEDTDVNLRTIFVDLQQMAVNMKFKNESIDRVYAVNWTPEIFYAYRDALKKDNIENWACFKDLLERYGVQVY